MSCSAVVSPASPTTYADPPRRWPSRNCAAASAEVQMASSGMSIPPARSRARRSRGVNIELFVRTRKRRPESIRAWMNSAAPGMACCSWTSTPSMSVSQLSTGLRSLMGTMVPYRDTAPGQAGRTSDALAVEAPLRAARSAGGLLLAEAVGDDLGDGVEDLLRLGAARPHGDLGTALEPERDEGEDAGAVHAVDLDLRVEPGGDAGEHGSGPGVQPERIAQLEHPLDHLALQPRLVLLRRARAREGRGGLLGSPAHGGRVGAALGRHRGCDGTLD